MDLLLSVDALGMKLLRLPFWVGLSAESLDRCVLCCAVLDGSVGIRESRGMPEGRVVGFEVGLVTDSSILFAFPYSFILCCIVIGSMSRIGNRSSARSMVGKLAVHGVRAMKQSFGGGWLPGGGAWFQA